MDGMGPAVITVEGQGRPYGLERPIQRLVVAKIGHDVPDIGRCRHGMGAGIERVEGEGLSEQLAGRGVLVRGEAPEPLEAEQQIVVGGHVRGPFALGALAVTRVAMRQTWRRSGVTV